HAGDAAQLSLQATFGRFADMEREHGGLVRATLAARRSGGGPAEAGGGAAAGRTPFVSLRTGVSELTDALVARLRADGVTLLSGRRVKALAPAPQDQGSGYRLAIEGEPDLEVDAVVLATPAHVTGPLVRDLCPTAAGLLGSIPHASTATVSLAYRVDDLAAGAPAGFGFVVPRVENRQLIAATWSSVKWPGRAPAGQVLVRGYVGGIGREAVMDLDDEALVGLVRAELAALAGIRAHPVHADVGRYPAGMPQYTVGHGERVRRIRRELSGWPGVAVTGAAYGGVGIPDCIRDATATAAAVVAELAARPI
ncbi:MAG TPA: protoporphyrinogen oxidase, partial [Acidimicrobiia bacterium]|nr:protoporphyrinogen oxidase [Acidimicrobiia bacterium]